MANIFDYIKWRGDISIDKVDFNEIDNLILARLAYFPFDRILNPQEKITIAIAYERFLENNDYSKILQKEDIDLFPELAKSKRFKNLCLTNYINKIELEQEKQFSAITIELPDKTIYVGYKGTDNTIVGWKEDFNMSFRDFVPAQADAKDYLEEIAKQYKGKIRIGGHSKGGNLAVFAAAFCMPKIQKRIIEVYNNDGPGFSDNITKSENYKAIIEKVHTYVPQSSVVGRLLNHEEKYTVVKSTQVGIMQHDLYSWQLMRGKFIYLEKVTNGSELVDKTIKDWLKQVSPEQREQFIDILFQILGSTQAKTLSEFNSKGIKNAKVLLTSYKNIDEESKQIINKTISSLFSIVKSNLLSKTPKKLENGESFKQIE